MKNYSDITESLDITTKQYVDQGLSSKADISELDKRVKLSTANATVGATDKPIYVKNGTAMVATDVMKEAFLQWGGKNFSADYGPLDAALISDLGADRFAFIPAAKWQVEYSRDNGRTWQDYGATDVQKLSLTSVGTSLSIGKATSENKATADYKLRLTLTTTNTVYSVLNKFAIDVSTNGSTGCYVTIEGRTKANVDAGANTWVTFAENIPVSGWSGWNIINTSGITTHGNTNNQYANLRFTFGCTGGSSTYSGLQIRRLKAFGGVGWQTPSNMAKYGSLYRYDYSQNALFPADVYIQNNIKVASVNDVSKKQDIISESNKLSAALVSGLATVATTGSYTDLSNTPTILSEADVKGIKVNNASYADVAGEARKISYNMLFEGYKHLGNGAMSETTMKYNGSDIRKLYFGDEFQFLNADSTTTDDMNKDHRLTLKPTGVAAGTYNSVTVDAKGRVTAGTNTPVVDTSNLAKLDAENTFTKGQVITGSTSGGYSVNASGYVKGSWLQSSVKSNYGSDTGMVCVFDGSGWIYYRTPSEILSEASGVPKSAFSLTGTTLTITI